MRTVIVGAGAIGGCIGARLAQDAGVPVAAYARGATLQALRTQGWRMDSGNRRWHAAVEHASDDAAALGQADLLVVAVKGQALAPLAPRLAPLVGPDTVILPAMNGVPWWFGRGLAVDSAGLVLDSVDPGGVIAQALPPSQVLGCVVHIAAGTIAPGHVQHRMGWGLIVGEPSGENGAESGAERGAERGAQPSSRQRCVVELLSRAGFEVTAEPAIHRALWYKLWGNVTMNPVSALTGATADRILDDPLVRSFCSAVMTEVAAVGGRIGCAIDQSPEDRHAVTRRLGAFKTSMLQDVEAGRSLELDAIVAAVREIAGQVGVATPNLDALFGLVRLMAQGRGLYTV